MISREWCGHVRANCIARDCCVHMCRYLLFSELVDQIGDGCHHLCSREAGVFSIVGSDAVVSV